MNRASRTAIAAASAYSRRALFFLILAVPLSCFKVPSPGSKIMSEALVLVGIKMATKMACYRVFLMIRQNVISKINNCKGNFMKNE